MNAFLQFLRLVERDAATSRDAGEMRRFPPDRAVWMVERGRVERVRAFRRVDAASRRR